MENLNRENEIIGADPGRVRRVSPGRVRVGSGPSPALVREGLRRRRPPAAGPLPRAAAAPLRVTE